MVRPKNAPPGLKKDSKSILGKRQKSPDTKKANVPTSSLQKEEVQDGLRSSKRARKTNMPYQIPESITSILRAVSKLEEAEKNQSRSSVKAKKSIPVPISSKSPVKRTKAIAKIQKNATPQKLTTSVKTPKQKAVKPAVKLSKQLQKIPVQKTPSISTPKPVKLKTKKKSDTRSKKLTSQVSKNTSKSGTPASVNGTTVKKSKKAIKVNLPISDSIQPEPAINPKKRKSRKGALNPKPHVTKFDKDPTFFSTLALPHVSTLAHSRLLIRAVLLNDMKLLKQLTTKDSNQIASACITRSIHIDRDVISYAFQLENKEALKILLDVDQKLSEKFGSFPELMLGNESTGHGSRMMFGHALRNVTVGRGGKEGNAAFLMDSGSYYGSKVPIDHSPRQLIEKAIKMGTSVDTLEYYITLVSKKNSYVGESLISNILTAVRFGRHDLAGKLISMAIKRSGHGFNQLHEEALVLEKNKPFSPFKSVSVIKKCTDNCRITPIHCAAINPNPYYLQTLLNSVPEYNLLDTGNWTPLHYAAVCSGDGPLKLLLSKAVPTMVIEKEGNTPLHLAVSRGRLSNVKLLLTSELANVERDDNEPAVTGGVSLMKVNKSGMTPLHIAALEGYDGISKVLLDAGADGNKCTPAQFDKLTPLMVACRSGHLEVVKLLIDRGVKVEIGDRRGRTAIAWAVINGHADIVSFLLRLGVNHETKDSSGNALTHYAAAYGWYFNMKLLLEAGCDPNQGNLWRMTPLALAFMKGHQGLVEMLVKQPGVDIDTPIDDSNGMSLLLKTCESSKLSASLIERLTFLIDQHKADCKKVDFEGNNALHHLARKEKLFKENKDFVQMLKYMLNAATLLIDRGCDSGALNEAKVSPLLYAINRGNFWLAEKLIELGPKLNTDVDSCGDTALHEIVRHASSSEAKLFYEKLAKDADALLTLKMMAKIYNNDGCTPLLQVLKSFKNPTPEASKLLNHCITFLVTKLDSDVNAFVKTKDGESHAVLHLAVASSYAESVIPILLTKNPHLDPVNNHQQTPLAIAVLNGLENVARLLINAGADVNFKLKSELSSGLLLVLGKNQTRLFSLIPFFVTKGADVKEVMSDSRNSIVHYISKSPAQIHALQALEAIIKAGADVNLKNSDGRTPLHLAVDARGKETDATYDVEDALLSAGADVTAKDIRGRTPLHYAFVKIGNPHQTSFFDPIELVMILVNAMKEANAVEAIRAKDEFGSTPLHYAAMRGSTICCSFLMTEMRGHIDTTDNRGNTPFGLAVWSGHEGCSLYFQQQGANFSKILDTNSQNENANRQDRAASKGQWIWSPKKLEKVELEMVKVQNNKYPIFQEVVIKDWQGILHLMLGSLKSLGTGVSVGVAAAIKTNRLRLALKLIHPVKYPKELEQKQETLLHTLAKYSKVVDQAQTDLQVEVVNSLLKKGVSPLQLDENRANASIYAAINLNYPLVLELSYALDNSNYLNVVSKLAPDSFGRTPFSALFWSLKTDTDFSKEIKSWATSLLSHGASANETSQYPFILSPHPGLRCFVRYDKQITSHPKYSPLTTAVIHGNYSIVKWLLSLKSKVDPNFGDEEGRTPLMHAARLNDVKMVKLLMSPDSYNYEKDISPWRVKYSSWVRGKGAAELDPSKRDKKGWTAADHFVCPALEEKVYAYKNVEPILTILHKSGVSFTTKSGDNTSPLERAIFHKRQHIVNIIYKLLKTPPHQQIATQQYEAFLKPENEPGLSPLQTNFSEDAKKAAEIKHKETEDKEQPTAKPDPLLELDEDNSVVVIDQEQTIPYDCVMTKVDISYGLYGLYNFYKMQVVKEPKGKERVFLFTQWGRVGDTGQHQKTPFATLDEAIKEFKKIFRSKSGNGWEKFNDFTPITKKYRLVNKELAKAKKAHDMKVDFTVLLNAAKTSRSVLKPEVYDAIKKMCLAHKLDSHSESMRYLNISTFEKSENMPIVTTEALKKGEDILKEIASTLQKKDNMPSVNPDEAESTALVEKMVTLSEEFYALVPVFGFATEKLQPIFDWNALRQRQEEIHHLIHLGFAKELLLAAELNSKLSNPFEYIYRCLGTKMQLLDMSKHMENEEAQMILQYIHNTKDQEVKIRGIYKIQRPDEAELTVDNRWLLWHGTKVENLLSILHNGLQVAPLGVNISGHLFGKGIYLADMFAKSYKYCSKTGGCDSKFMLLCEVALGKVHEVNIAMAAEQAEGSGRFLPVGHDSLKTSDSRYEPDPRVSVVWKGRTVPLGTRVDIEYKDDESWDLNYNEFIVFNQNQVKLRYLIEFDD